MGIIIVTSKQQWNVNTVKLYSKRLKLTLKVFKLECGSTFNGRKPPRGHPKFLNIFTEVQNMQPREGIVTDK